MAQGEIKLSMLTGCCDGRGQLWYQSLSFCLGTNLDTREALSITELLSLHSFNSPFPSGNLRKANRAQLDFPFYLQTVTGGLTSYLSGESLASESTGVFKRKNLGSKQAFQRARKGFLSVPRCLLSFWMGKGAMRRRCPSSLWWRFFHVFQEIGVCDLYVF